MNPIYDVAILGCGEAGIFAAYELAHHRPGLKVLALDQAASAARGPFPTASSTSPPSSAAGSPTLWSPGLGWS